MFVEQWRLHTLTFHFMLYWLGLSVIFFLSSLLKSCPPGSIRVATCPSAVVAIATSPPATFDCAVPSSWQCHTKGWSGIWDSSANWLTTPPSCCAAARPNIFWEEGSSRILYHLYSSWATALGAVWGSASLHVNKFRNLASEEERGLQVSSQFYFALELHWNAFNVLELNYPPLPGTFRKHILLG